MFLFIAGILTLVFMVFALIADRMWALIPFAACAAWVAYLVATNH